MAKLLAQTLSIDGASIIGQPGGWSVSLRVGSRDQALSAQRSGQPRTWRSLDRCVHYLRSELQLTQFELLDATQHSDIHPPRKRRADTSERMRKTHESAAFDLWWKAQVQEGMKEAQDASTPWVSNDTAMTESLKRRQLWEERAQRTKDSS